MTFDENETEVANQMSNYWGSFARTGDPSQGLETPITGEFTNWIPYVREGSNNWLNMRLEPPKSRLEYNYNEDICDFWDSLNYYVVMPEPPTTVGLIESTTSGGKIHQAFATLLFFVILLFDILCLNLLV